ncbi:MAG: hypothetical protein K9N57_00455 [Candidatus Marinimicrobia bacterium]|nr:hypothetical protein [Candidatus Neomarinimicrobiota bacterium]
MRADFNYGSIIQKFLLGLLLLCIGSLGYSQGLDETSHRRGLLWENLRNDGWIGSLGAWDYLVSSPLGLYPGFEGYHHPVGSEFNAVNTFSNANYHNFRSGVWIVTKDLLTPGNPPDFNPTPTDYEVYAAGLQGNAYGILSNRTPIQQMQNFIEEPDFDPNLPEEMTTATWHTNTGISVNRRSYVWSYPRYDDFIIYDYTFTNTGEMVSTLADTLVRDFPEQTLEGVYFVFHSGISVSTKHQINFHTELTAVQAGGFGWQPESYHDYYHNEDGGALVYSTNYNAGIEPMPWDPYQIKDNEFWKQKFGDEMLSPAAFGWLALYASSTDGTPRTSPAPDVLRIDSHKGGTFMGNDLDLERFNVGIRPERDFYEFAKTPDLQEGVLGNEGNRMNFYSLSYGPYTLAPGESVRFVIAEIAGVMDYANVVAGDTTIFPDSTIAAIRRNAEAAREAVKWGMGAQVDTLALAADVPEPPPYPTTNAANASEGSENPAIAVTWDKLAENSVLQDGTGNTYYDGSTDLDGYRVYRSRDFQYVSDTQQPVLRGAYWNLLKDIPSAEFDNYWDPDLGLYRFVDENVEFGRRYGYYVSAYDSDPNDWTSANGTTVQNLPELASGSTNRTPPTSAAPGPVENFDIYVAPNPFVFNEADRSFGRSDPYKLEFRNLPERCTIRIYTVAGDLVRTLRHQPDAVGNLSGSESWDQKSDSGLLVAPGLYVYHVQSQTEGLNREFTGKLMLIR